MINSVNVNSVNSYSNYNNYNASLNSQTQIKNSQNTSLENKKANRSISSKESNSNKIFNQTNNNTYTNNTLSSKNPMNNKFSHIQEINPNLVSDVSQATSQILGYGVDKEGFFTSDFNEAAGLPKDYKIDAKMLIATLNLYTKTGFYNNIDLAKSFNNAYESFKTQNSFDVIANKGKALVHHFLAYRRDFLEGEVSVFGKLLGFDKNISQIELKSFQSFMNENRIKNPFLNPKNSISPNTDFSTKELLSNGGMRLNVSEYEDLMREDWNYLFDETSFEISVNSTDEFYPEFSSFIGGIRDDYYKLLKSNINLEEFKTQYLKIKERFDEFIEKVKNLHQEKFENGSFAKISQNSNTQDNENTEKTDNKPFKAIQGESKSQTYKDTDRLNALELAKDRQLANMLEILFGFKSNSPLNNIDKNNLLIALNSHRNFSENSNKNLSKANSLDIKA